MPNRRDFPGLAMVLVFGPLFGIVQDWKVFSEIAFIYN